ncbi:unnamed protein product [Acanthoscelides obtectus]|uniref:Uncharacterized protein n=1 Tax=Acanthoscelides obtectus TaxID=200917 RepID=A0A9P0LBK7_ACAOB|nr:unnamed protein product [Acanthoscelides obtectus]CAK1667869.1 hypothetical protein AOBTE_LOCUS26081 [Acanthoscelides obtectus]
MVINIIYRIRTLYILILFQALSVTLAFTEGASKVKQRSTKEKSLSMNTSGQKSAIIAIQIIDEADEKAGGEKSKRTIDSALGNGYHGHAGKVPPPKFMIYKYSQHDIPPYNGPPLLKQQSGGHAGHSAQSYSPAATPPQIAHIQPGMTLFSTINQNGHVGTFSSHLPQNLMFPHTNSGPIPVIILRILPAQLQEPTGHLYPNIPSSNSFASIINSLDIKALLNGIPQPISSGLHSSGYQAPQLSYSAPVHGGVVSSYLSKGTNSYSQPVAASLQVGTHQNRYTASPKPTYIQKVTSSYVPSKAVSFMRTDHGYMYQEHQQYTGHPEPQQYLQPQYQEQHQHQYQEQPQYQEQQYSQEQYYPQEKEQQYSQEQYEEPQRYHSQGTESQGGGHGQYQQEYQQQYSSDNNRDYGLLTHENYPSDKHTKVIFKDLDGSIRSQAGEGGHTKVAPVAAPTPVPDYSNQNLDYGDHQQSDSTQYDYEAEPQMELKKLYYKPVNQKT